MRWFVCRKAPEPIAFLYGLQLVVRPAWAVEDMSFCPTAEPCRVQSHRPRREGLALACPAPRASQASQTAHWVGGSSPLVPGCISARHLHLDQPCLPSTPLPKSADLSFDARPSILDVFLPHSSLSEILSCTPPCTSVECLNTGAHDHSLRAPPIEQFPLDHTGPQGFVRSSLGDLPRLPPSGILEATPRHACTPGAPAPNSQSRSYALPPAHSGFPRRKSVPQHKARRNGLACQGCTARGRGFSWYQKISSRVQMH